MPLLPSFHKFLTFFFSPSSIQGVCRGAALSQGIQDQEASKGRTQGEPSSCMGIGVACLLLLNQSVSELYLFIVFIPTARDIRRLFASWKNPRRKRIAVFMSDSRKGKKRGTAGCSFYVCGMHNVHILSTSVTRQIKRSTGNLSSLQLKKRLSKQTMPHTRHERNSSKWSSRSFAFRRGFSILCATLDELFLLLLSFLAVLHVLEFVQFLVSFPLFALSGDGE